MKIIEYLENINLNSQQVFKLSIQDPIIFAKAHHSASFIGEFSDFVFDEGEKKMILTVAIQLESATINLLHGMYRESFSSLRLALELGLGAIYFSAHKLEQNEWIKGENDIKWSKLIDNDNGVLSKRFCNAFFSELSQYAEEYNDKSKDVYRKMSEFVHGNYDTWNQSGLILKFNSSLKDEYFKFYNIVSEVLIFMLCCRYMKLLSPQHKETICEYLLEELKHISPIREFLGGAKEL